MKKNQVLDLETLIRVPFVDSDRGFDISPDGKLVAFAWNCSGEWEIYLLPLDGSTPAQAITTPPGAKFAPHWSPDGQHLAYVVDNDGGEQFDLWTYSLQTHRHLNLTPDTPFYIEPAISWSPDGQWLAYISDQSGSFEVYRIPVSGGETQKLFPCEQPAIDVTWSPDGSYLGVSTLAKGQDIYSFVVDLHNRQSFALSQGGEPLRATNLSWSPDGQRLAFASNQHGYHQLGIFEINTRNVSWVTEGEKEHRLVSWSPDGKRLAYVVEKGPFCQLFIQGLPYSDGLEAGVYSRPHFTPDGNSLIYVFDNPGHPNDLWQLSLQDGTLRQLTQSLPKSLREVRFAMPQETEYPSLDGQRVPALIYRPAQTADSLPPAVVSVHGGPNWLAQVTWDPLIQHMVSRGWVVLAPNYRGSTGYGRAWQELNRFDLGNGDTQDVVAAADYLAQKSLADPELIAVTGRSYGGYMTMTSLTQYPDRFAVGCAVVPFVNWFTGHDNVREDLKYWDYENFGHPEENYERYYRRSPFFFLHRISAPVQLICGAHDPRCPAAESTQAYNVLQMLGKPCNLLLYADEGHAFLKIHNVVDHKLRLVKFLADVLENGHRAL